MKAWLATTKTHIELVRKLRCLDLTEVRAIEAVCISRVPPEKSKNTQHKQRAPKLNLNERCNFTTTMPAQQRKQPQPSISDDTKYLRWKVQQRGFKPKYFSYRRQDTREAEQQARAWRF
jgi:hypothetical protein